MNVAKIILYIKANTSCIGTAWLGQEAVTIGIQAIFCQGVGAR